MVKVELFCRMPIMSPTVTYYGVVLLLAEWSLMALLEGLTYQWST